jgi:ParB family chromosome partitioning protein
MQKKGSDALGKGIRSLLQHIDSDLKNTTGSLKSEIVEQTTSSVFMGLDQIDVNPRQPRTDFEEAALNELAASIRIHGVIQPLTITQTSSGRFKLIAGERRYRASKLAGLKEVPVYIRQTDDQHILEIALLENLQRENLNAIEISLAYKRLMDDLDYTQEQLAERMGKDRSTITNYLRLLKLPPDIQASVRSGMLSMGHARAIVNVDAVDKQIYIFKEIKQKGLSVRQTEELVRKLYTGEKKKPNKATGEAAPGIKNVEDKLCSHFGTKVRVNHHKSTGRGSIQFEYYSLDELNGLLEKLNVSIG